MHQCSMRCWNSSSAGAGWGWPEGTAGLAASQLMRRVVLELQVVQVL